MSEFVLQYISPTQLGKATRSAKDLAERARHYTRIKIVVVPTPELDELKTENAKLRAVADEAVKLCDSFTTPELHRVLQAAGFLKQEACLDAD